MARYLKDSHSLFLHIPRTGGTWVEHAIHTLNISYARYSTMKADWLPSKHIYFPHFIRRAHQQTRFLWCIVRHPIDYWEAIWRWATDVQSRHRWKLKKCGSLGKWSWHPQMRAADLYSDNFDTWVERMLEDQGAWVTRTYWLYTGPTGGEWCSYIGHQETLENDFMSVMKLLGYDEALKKYGHKISDLGRINQNRTTVKIGWREDLRRQVEREERLAINRWYSNETISLREYGPLIHIGIEALLDGKEGRARDEPDWKLNRTSLEQRRHARWKKMRADRRRDMQKHKRSE